MVRASPIPHVRLSGDDDGSALTAGVVADNLPHVLRLLYARRAQSLGASLVASVKLRERAHVALRGNDVLAKFLDGGARRAVVRHG